MTTLPYPKVHVVINPAAGQDEPILNVLNDVFHPAGVDWDNSLTHKSAMPPDWQLKLRHQGSIW